MRQVAGIALDSSHDPPRPYPTHETASDTARRLSISVTVVEEGGKVVGFRAQQYFSFLTSGTFGESRYLCAERSEMGVTEDEDDNDNDNEEEIEQKEEYEEEEQEAEEDNNKENKEEKNDESSKEETNTEEIEEEDSDFELTPILVKNPALV